MNIRLIRTLASVIAVLGFAAISSEFSALQAQGTAFTYQGQLLTTNGPAHGIYNLTFALYNAASGGSQFGGTVQTNGVVVSNGLFTVTVDFNSGIFTGTEYWLQIGVETNGAALFTTLTGRQQLTPVPYAIYSEGGNAAGLTGTIPSTGLSGSYSGVLNLNNAGNSFSGNGSGLTGVNAAQLNGLSSANFWQTTGNAGTTPGPNFVGATDGKALELNPGGTVGVGTATPLGRLDVEGRSGDVNSLYVLNGSLNGNGVYVNATNGSEAYAVWALSSGPGVVVNSTGNGVVAAASSATSIGVSGAHNAATGTAAGVQGATYSADGYANGVYGVVESTAPGAYSAGVMGQNNSTNYDGIGVYGSQNGSGYGVYGTTPSGDAVVGYSTAGIGVYGESSSYIGLYGYSDTSYGVYAESFFGTGLYAYSGGADGIDAYTYSSNSIGIYGEHSESGGTAAAVQGTTYSADSFANAVYGLVSPTSPGGFSTAVRGQNNGTSGSGIGVYGSQNGSGWGVYGYTPSGYGVYGDTGSGTAVYAYSGTGSALTIGNGAVHISNSGTNSTSTAAFIWFANSGNSGANYTIVNNTLCNGDPNAILVVTPNLSPNGTTTVYNNHPIGVWYNGSKWEIFNQDDSAVPAGAAFNVLIIKN